MSSFRFWSDYENKCKISYSFGFRSRVSLVLVNEMKTNLYRVSLPRAFWCPSSLNTSFREIIGDLEAYLPSNWEQIHQKHHHFASVQPSSSRFLFQIFKTFEINVNRHLFILKQSIGPVYKMTGCRFHPGIRESHNNRNQLKDWKSRTKKDKQRQTSL